MRSPSSVLLIVLAVCGSGQAATVNLPSTAAPGSLTFTAPEEPSFIENLPLDNLVSWEIFLRNPGTSLTFTGGVAPLYDEAGTPLAGYPKAVDPALYVAVLDGVEYDAAPEKLINQFFVPW